MTTHLTDTDRQIIGLMAARNEDLRSLFATLARLGVQWRHAENARCQEWITTLEPHPFYKAGQVIFDLFEWEDFILDGSNPADVSLNLLPRLNSFLANIEGMPEIPIIDLTMHLPELEPGFYLYRDVILGGLWLIVTAAASESISVLSGEKPPKQGNFTK